MRRIVKATAPLLIGLFSISLLFRCGSPTDPSLSGGSGAGNPGGTVALSMLASRELSLPKLSIGGSSYIDILAGSQPVIATDRAGQAITITNVLLSNVDIHFMLDTLEIPSYLLPSMSQWSSEISIDTHSIMLSGPYRFDVLEGNVDSSIRVLCLPVARYTGIMLHFNRDSLAGDEFPSQLVMNGSCVFNGITHSISIDLGTPSGLRFQQSFRFSGGIFTLTPNDTTNLQIQFNVQKWFSHLDLASFLFMGSFSIEDSANTLVISNRSTHSASEDIGDIIFKDFIASGRLVVF
jgi:hypothetical protein